MISCQSIYGFDTSSMKGLQLIFNPLFINLDLMKDWRCPYVIENTVKKPNTVAVSSQIPTLHIILHHRLSYLLSATKIQHEPLLSNNTG